MAGKKRVVMMVLLGCGLSGALAAVAVLGSRSSRRAPTAKVSAEPVAVSAVAAPKQVDAEPTFGTAEQAAKYYGAVVAGERRALAAVDAALEKLRARGQDPGQVSRLESLRGVYAQRLRLHEAKLTQ